MSGIIDTINKNDSSSSLLLFGHAPINDFFCHVKIQGLKIMAVSKNRHDPISNPDYTSVKIKEELALKLITGEYNIGDYYVHKDGNGYKISNEVPEEEWAYCHIDTNKMIIVSISIDKHDPDKNQDLVSIKIKHSLAMRLITGEETMYKWQVLKENGRYILKHEDEIEKEKLDRLESLSIFEVTEDTPNADIRVVINDPLYKGLVAVYYHAGNIYNWKTPAKIYFTREDDASYLKCILNLGHVILNEMLVRGNLTEWPNPILLNLVGADDISVFTTRSNYKIAIYNYETRNNKL